MAGSRPLPRPYPGVAPFQAALTAAAEQLARARAKARILFEHDNSNYGRVILRRIAFIETCIYRALTGITAEERARSLEFGLRKIDESRELLHVMLSRRPTLERSAKFLRPVLNTTRAVLTAGKRLGQAAEHARHRDVRVPQTPLK